MIGLSTAASTNACVNSRLSPRSSFNNFVPYVGISVPFAADRENPVSLFPWGNILKGITEISAPESIRNCNAFS